MTDEQDGLDPSSVKRKLTKRERFRGAVQRGVNKVKKSDEESTRDGEFALNEDVKDFLTFRSPYSKPATIQPSTPEPHITDPKTSTPPDANADIDHFLHKTDPADVLPHFPILSRDPLPVPRIDIAKSPRFPHARDLSGDKGDDDIVSALRIKDETRSPSIRKKLRKGLAVRFTENPPMIIGEGGDEAEIPTIYLLQTRARSRSDAPLPALQQDLRQVSPSHVQRRPVASPAQHTSSHHTSPLQISPQNLQSMEFDMTLTSGLNPQTTPIQPTSVGKLESPAARTNRLRMRAEEGKSLRESFHDSSFNSVPD